MPEANGFEQANLLPFNIRAVLQKDIFSIIDPDFSIDVPDGFLVTEGAGNRDSGSVLWTKISDKGYEEIEVQWQKTARREIILQDIYQKVANYRSSAQAREYSIWGKKKVDLGGVEANAAFGEWEEKVKGIGGKGVWTMTMKVAEGRAYTVECSVSMKGPRKLSEEWLEKLESVFGTFRAPSAPSGEK
jgi:hypothetical protein